MPAVNGWRWNMPSLPPSDPALNACLQLLVSSYRRLTGRMLISAPQNDAALAAAVWNAPLAIVAHGTEVDPVFFYGNRLALQRFEMSFEEFSRLPSRFSAEPLARNERASLLERVTQYGYVDDYSGIRISRSGTRFTIGQATVWNLLDETGGYHGQAAAFVVPT